MNRIDRTLVMLLLSNAFASVGIGVAMIAVPWMLASMTGGGVLFGVLITVANIALAVMTPWTGAFIDSLRRKSFMIGLRAAFIAGLAAVLFLALIDVPREVALVLYYVMGAAFYAINIPLRTAFVQELYDGSAYRRVNSILEIENQVAAVITGGVAILLMERVGLPMIVVLNIGCLAVAILCIAAITHTANAALMVRKNPVQDIRDGIAIMMRERRLSIVLMVASLPYVTVILYTYLHPVALSQLLSLSGDVYALVEVFFAAGAILGGWAILTVTIPAHRLEATIRVLVGLFASVAIVQALLPTKAAFLTVAILFGLLNAVIRILRQTVLMDRAAPAEIGRIGAFLQCWIMTLRAIFLGALTALVAGVGVVPALWLAALLPFAGWLVLRALPLHDDTQFSRSQEALQ